MALQTRQKLDFILVRMLVGSCEQGEEWDNDESATLSFLGLKHHWSWVPPRWPPFVTFYVRLSQ